MRKLIISAAALAMLASSPMGFVGAAQAAWTDDIPGGDVCGPLPNPKWSWAVSSTIVTSGGGISESTSTASTYSGGSPVPNNGWSTTTTTTTTAPSYSQTNTVCTALNPTGKINLDHSTTVEGPLVETDPGGTNIVVGDETKICDNNNNDNAAGNALPACPAV